MAYSVSHKSPQIQSVANELVLVQPTSQRQLPECSRAGAISFVWVMQLQCFQFYCALDQTHFAIYGKQNRIRSTGILQFQHRTVRDFYSWSPSISFIDLLEYFPHGDRRHSTFKSTSSFRCLWKILSKWYILPNQASFLSGNCPNSMVTLITCELVSRIEENYRLGWTHGCCQADLSQNKSWKNAIAVFSFWITMHRDALNTLERKISRAQADVAAFSDKSNSFATVKMHKCNQRIRSTANIFGSAKCIGFQAPRCQDSPTVVSLPLRRVMSVLFLSTSGLWVNGFPRFIKSNHFVEVIMTELADQLRKWYGMELYGAYKTSRSHLCSRNKSNQHSERLSLFWLASLSWRYVMSWWE